MSLAAVFRLAVQLQWNPIAPSRRAGILSTILANQYINYLARHTYLKRKVTYKI